MQSGFSPGSLVRARGRDWIVLPGREPSVLHLPPLTRGQADEIGIYLPLEGRLITSARAAAIAPSSPIHHRLQRAAGGERMVVRDPARERRQERPPCPIKSKPSIRRRP
jgi:hypothetical protein